MAAWLPVAAGLKHTPAPNFTLTNKFDMTTSKLKPSRQSMSAEELEACEPIEQYFLGHARNDAAPMRRAFLPTARIESMQQGTFTSWSLDVYCERFKGVPAEDEAHRIRTIDWIELAGDAASARVTLRHGPITFTDYFLLLKTAGEWRIASKAFHGKQTDVA